MIQSKQDYKNYLMADWLASGRHKPTNETLAHKIGRFVFGDNIWKYQKTLRKTEYLKNCKQGTIGKVRYYLALFSLKRQADKLGFEIYPNNFGPGLYIPHRGMIVLSSYARIGANCRIHAGTVIGNTGGYRAQAPVIGNNVFIGSGAKIFGKIEIADNIAIGANAVVNKSFKNPE